MPAENEEDERSPSAEEHLGVRASNQSAEEEEITFTAPPADEVAPPTAEQSPEEALPTAASSTKPEQEEIDFTQDPLREMTYGRRLALYMKDKYSWYYNKDKAAMATGDDAEQPSLEKAWAFFEHITLERYVVHNKGMDDSERQERASMPAKLVQKVHKGDRKLDIAEPGEKHLRTKLYSPLNTPLSQLGDFGLGYGLYFSTLRAFGMLCLFAGILNIPSLIHYASDEYSGEQDVSSALLKGSAICTDRTWVPCPTCTPEQFTSFGVYEPVRTVESDYIPHAVPRGEGDWLNITGYFFVDPTDDGSLTCGEMCIVSLLFNFQIVFTFPENGEESYYELPHTEWLYPLSDWLDLSGTLGDRHAYIYVEPGHGDIVYHSLGFALKNNCEAPTEAQGLSNWATLSLLIFGTFVIRLRQKTLIVKFDEDEMTAQDFSIEVMNPPDDAFDPEEWRQFFEENFDCCKVTVCTVAVDNDVILNLLVTRRNIIRQLEFNLPPGTALDLEMLESEVEKVANMSFLSRMCNSIPKLVGELKDVNKQIADTLGNDNKKYQATKVFVTFETESAQREVLTKLSVGALAAMKNDKSAVPVLFRGEHVLEVFEPEEPTAIIWEHLNATRGGMHLRVLKTSIVTAILIAIAFCSILGLYALGLPWFATTVTTIFTVLFPTIAKMLMNYEHHHTESSRQKWLFIKIALFNILTTTLLTTVVTPFTVTLDDKQDSTQGLVPIVFALFWSQLTISPLLQILDIGGNISRHFLAPRAKTQDTMNMNMRGSVVFLAERYANLIKYMFLIFWYSALFPGGFFLGSIALLIIYFADRFSMMRTWARTPQLGTEIADFARNYFTPAAIVFLAVTSAYFWSGFPFDNLCEDTESSLHFFYEGNWEVEVPGANRTYFGHTVFKAPDTVANFTIEPNDTTYKYCNQDMRILSGRSFPPFPKFQPAGSEWMTEEQEEIVLVFAWSSMLLLAALSASYLFRLCRSFKSFVSSSYVPRGEDQHINFSTVPAIDSYVPQVGSPFFNYPLLVCKAEELDEKLFNWSDPDKPRSFYDLTKDAGAFMEGGLKNEERHIFPMVKHWPAPVKA